MWGRVGKGTFLGSHKGCIKRIKRIPAAGRSGLLATQSTIPVAEPGELLTQEQFAATVRDAINKARDGVIGRPACG